MGDISPRVKLASRLYASGSVPTKEEAAKAAGLSPSYFYVASSPGNGREEVHELMDQVDSDIHDKTIEMTATLISVGREALSEIRHLMKSTKNEAIKLGAAKDLADRSPETSKVQKHQVESLSLSGHDARQLASALVAATEARRLYGDQVNGDFIRVPIAAESIGEATSQESPSAHRTTQLSSEQRVHVLGERGTDSQPTGEVVADQPEVRSDFAVSEGGSVASDPA